MSNIYVHEPPTSGKVVLRTSGGDVEIELWSKEAPRACRNFLQLALEGYFDGCIFHRIVKDFLVQTGDPTGDGSGGESVYSEPFPDEIHSRLKFRARGMLAMAKEENEVGNRSQFFITLGACEWLNGMNTIFGKVVGDTIFNVVRFADLEVDAHDRPMFPPKIKHIDITHNPFDDILPRVTIHKDADKSKKLSKPIVKNKNLLSFGEEEGDEEDEENDYDRVRTGKSKLLSLHPSVAGAMEAAPTQSSGADAPKEGGEEKKPSKPPGKKSFIVQDSSDEDSDEGDRSPGALRKPEDKSESTAADTAKEARDNYKRIRDEIVEKKRLAKASLTGRKEDAEKLKREEDFVSPLEARRAKYLHKRRVAEAGGRETKTLEKLKAFRGNLKAPAKGRQSGSESGEDGPEEDTKLTWMQHELEFPRDVHNQEDDYVVQDPLEGKRGKFGEKIKKRRRGEEHARKRER